MSIGIYKIENLKNGKVYIGQSIHIERRWQEHSAKSSSSLIGKAIQKYGKENFSFQILEICNIEELDFLEGEYILKYNSLVPNGYNVVLNSPEKVEIFYHYDSLIFMSIVNDLKEDILSFKEIASKYELDLSTVYYINRGDYHTISNEIYPLREVKDLSKKYHYCIDCGIEISKGAVRCKNCSAKNQQVSLRPNREELKQMIRVKSFVEIGKQYGVSDKAVSKWCKVNNLPFKKKDIKQLTDEDWEKI